MPARGLILLTVLSTGALAVLIGLGLWQLQRLQWKEGLIAEIEARVKAEPVSLKEAVARAHAGEDVSYLRVRAGGKLNGEGGARFAVVENHPFITLAAEFNSGDIAKMHNGDVRVARGSRCPGWRWATDVGPIAGTDRAEVGE
jgi:surfeit locus 1 family protein